MSAPSVPQSALYASIHSQPTLVRRLLNTLAPPAVRAAAMLAQVRRIILAGTGTSSHAAVVGEHLFRLAGVDAYATTLFDFVTYPRPLGPEDAVIVISHRGSKRYGGLAIDHALASGAQLIGITGQGSPMMGPELVFETAQQETSSTHSASYLGNLTALAMIACQLGALTGVAITELQLALEDLPASLDSLLAREDALRPAAQELAAGGRLILAGAGPNAVTAREGALKIKESSYLVAEGFELETVLHGPLPAVQSGDVAVTIAAEGPALQRTIDLVRAFDLLQTHLLVVADERVVSRLPSPCNTALPPIVFPFAAVPEAFSPLLATVPLQLLAAFTAEYRGTNADNFRDDSPSHKRAHASYTL